MKNRRSITIHEYVQSWIFRWRGYQLRENPERRPELNHTSAINILLREAIEERMKLKDPFIWDGSILT